MSHKDNTLVVIVVLLALLLLFSFNWGFGYMNMMFFGPVFMILTIVLIVWLIISLTQNNKR